MTRYNGYKKEYKPSHHRAHSNGMVYSHIIAAEEKLGRLLKEGEVVHHVNEKRDDNRHSNIIVFKTSSDHAKYHNSGYKKRIEDYYIAPSIASIDNISKFCKGCGTKVYERSTTYLCKTCANLETRVVERPIRQQLKKDIRELSMTDVGKKYGVSCNAIRKWCVNKNLPSKVTDIRNYSDKEWSKI